MKTYKLRWILAEPAINAGINAIKSCGCCNPIDAIHAGDRNIETRLIERLKDPKIQRWNDEKIKCDRKTDARWENAIDAIDAYDRCDQSFSWIAIDAIDTTGKPDKRKIDTRSPPAKKYFPIQITSEGNRLVSNFEIEISSNHCLRQSSLARQTETFERIAGARNKVDKLK